LGGFVIHDVDMQIASLAGDYVQQYGPSHGVGPIDAIIAATAQIRAEALATLNLKHFPMCAGLKRAYEA
jgi:predicted nucleic acid-binding protein